MTADMKTMTLNLTIAAVIPAKAGIQHPALLVRTKAGSVLRTLDCRLRGNDEAVRTDGK